MREPALLLGSVRGKPKRYKKSVSYRAVDLNRPPSALFFAYNLKNSSLQKRPNAVVHSVKFAADLGGSLSDCFLLT